MRGTFGEPYHRAALPGDRRYPGVLVRILTRAVRGQVGAGELVEEVGREHRGERTLVEPIAPDRGRADVRADVVAVGVLPQPGRDVGTGEPRVPKGAFGHLHLGPHHTLH